MQSSLLTENCKTAKTPCSLFHCCCWTSVVFFLFLMTECSVETSRYAYCLKSLNFEVHSHRHILRNWICYKEREKKNQRLVSLFSFVSHIIQLLFSSYCVYALFLINVFIYTHIREMLINFIFKIGCSFEWVQIIFILGLNAFKNHLFNLWKCKHSFRQAVVSK